MFYDAKTNKGFLANNHAINNQPCVTSNKLTPKCQNPFFHIMYHLHLRRKNCTFDQYLYEKAKNSDFIDLKLKF